MAADLFETYAVTIVATMLLAATFFSGQIRSAMMLLPLLIGAVCIVASVAGTFFVRLGKRDRDIMRALYKGLIVSGVISASLIVLVINNMFGFDGVIPEVNGSTIRGIDLIYCSFVGLAVTALMVWITEFYTS